MTESADARLIPVDQVRQLITEIVYEAFGGKPDERLQFLEERLAALELKLIIPRR